MGYIIKYSRVGNAQQIYQVTHPDSDEIAFHSSVESVYTNVPRGLGAIRNACREARKHGYFMLE